MLTQLILPPAVQSPALRATAGIVREVRGLVIVVVPQASLLAIALDPRTVARAWFYSFASDEAKRAFWDQWTHDAHETGGRRYLWSYLTAGWETMKTTVWGHGYVASHSEEAPRMVVFNCPGWASLDGRFWGWEHPEGAEQLRVGL